MSRVSPMSIKTMSAVWEKSRQKGSALLLLLAVANAAGDDGEAEASLNYLAANIRMSREYTKALIRKLIRESDPELERISGEGGNPTNKSRYRVLIAPREARLPGRQGTPGPGRPASGGPPPREARLGRQGTPIKSIKSIGINKSIHPSNPSIHHPDGRTDLSIFSAAYGLDTDRITPAQAKNLAEIYAALGQHEYTRLIEWGAARTPPMSISGLAKTARRWEPERTAGEQPSGAGKKPRSFRVVEQ